MYSNSGTTRVGHRMQCFVLTVDAKLVAAALPPLHLKQALGQRAVTESRSMLIVSQICGPTIHCRPFRSAAATWPAGPASSSARAASRRSCHERRFAAGDAPLQPMPADWAIAICGSAIAIVSAARRRCTAIIATWSWPGARDASTVSTQSYSSSDCPVLIASQRPAGRDFLGQFHAEFDPLGLQAGRAAARQPQHLPLGGRGLKDDDRPVARRGPQRQPLVQDVQGLLQQPAAERQFDFASSPSAAARRQASASEVTYSLSRLRPGRRAQNDKQPAGFRGARRAAE